MLQSIPWAHVIPVLNSMSSNKIFNTSTYGKRRGTRVQIINLNNCLIINFDAMTTIDITASFVHVIHYSTLCGWEKGMFPNCLMALVASLAYIFFKISRSLHVQLPKIETKLK